MPCGPGDGSESCSVDVRRIDNGYVIRESRCSDGQYHSSERYSQEKPSLDGGLDNGSTTSAMKEAMKELNRK